MSSIVIRGLGSHINIAQVACGLFQAFNINYREPLSGRRYTSKVMTESVILGFWNIRLLNKLGQ